MGLTRCINPVINRHCCCNTYFWVWHVVSTLWSIDINCCCNTYFWADTWYQLCDKYKLLLYKLYFRMIFEIIEALSHFKMFLFLFKLYHNYTWWANFNNDGRTSSRFVSGVRAAKSVTCMIPFVFYQPLFISLNSFVWSLCCSSL